jgi:UDP-3-O-[3-hydroxymyristoyl] N-acetylglucosamine deacetylase
MSQAVALQSTETPRILIVDDEQSICRILAQIMEDEGYAVKIVNDGESALGVLEEFQPSVVFLDIWMPGVDGIEVLKKIKSSFANPPPVVMISGHATIATAVEATKIGADAFIEKPLDLENVLQVVNRCLSKLQLKIGVNENTTIQPPIFPPISKSDFFPSSIEAERLEPAVVSNTTHNKDFVRVKSNSYSIQPLVFNQNSHLGTVFKQKTIKSSAILYGQGLHSGRKSGLVFEPLPPNSGIHFAAVAEATTIPAHLNFVKSTGFATTLRYENSKIATIEHILSALNAYGITNLLIKCENEVPVMDGSAQAFCDLLDEVGIKEEEETYHAIKITQKIRVGNRSEWIEIEPDEGFSVDYTLNYPKPVGIQRFCFKLDGSDSYKKEIASARTFGFIDDIGHLQKQGLALGGRFDNFVLIGEQGPLNGELRFVDEFVRHKILDVIGDLYLLGRRIDGKVKARMTGHSDNIDLLKEIRKAFK